MKFSPLYPHLFLSDGGEIYAYGIKRLVQYNSDNRYLRVSYKNRNYLVHRVVASIHCEGYAPGLQVDHIDGNKLNNDPTNLEWVTHKENSRRAWALGLTNNSGENSAGAVLSAADVIEIRNRYAAGETQQSLADSFGICREAVGDIVRGRNWKHLPLTTGPRVVRPGWMTPELLSKALALVRDGMSIRAAALQLGIKPSTLQYAVRTHKARAAQDVNNAMKELT